MKTSGLEHQSSLNLYTVDNRIAVLETKEENTDRRFTQIEHTLQELQNDTKDMLRQLTALAAASSARYKMWLFIFSMVSAIAAIFGLGLHTAIFKFFGINA